jgi:hypothetical protein
MKSFVTLLFFSVILCAGLSPMLAFRLSSCPAAGRGIYSSTRRGQRLALAPRMQMQGIPKAKLEAAEVNKRQWGIACENTAVAAVSPSNDASKDKIKFRLRAL